MKGDEICYWAYIDRCFAFIFIKTENFFLNLFIHVIKYASV